MVRITLNNRPISKKNSRKLTRRGNKIMSFPSNAYESFKALSLGEINNQRVKHKIQKFTEPIHININFEIKGKYKVDLDNLVTSVCDILEDAQIVENDVIIDSILARKTRGHDTWRTVIEIEPYEIAKNQVFISI